MDQLPAFLPAGLALTGSPGPVVFDLAAVGAAFGARRGLGFLFGVCCGIVAVMTVAAAYICYLAHRTATVLPLGDHGEAGRAPSALDGGILQLCSPRSAT